MATQSKRSLAFVTTCKSRFEHARQTIPLMVAAAPEEIVFVDYGCPEKSGAWVEKNFPSVKVVYVKDDPEFCVSRARNIGAAASKSEWLAFVDVDVLVQPGFVPWLKKHLLPFFHYRATPLDNGDREKQTWGTHVTPRMAFDLVGGYDEVFRGWGGEDDDLYSRMTYAGFPEVSYPREFVKAIDHDDSLRTMYHPWETKTRRMLASQLYRDLKGSVMMAGTKNRNMTVEGRRKLMAMVQARVDELVSSGAKGPVKMELHVDTTRRSGEFRVEKRSTFTINVFLDEEDSADAEKTQADGTART